MEKVPWCGQPWERIEQSRTNPCDNWSSDTVVTRKLAVAGYTLSLISYQLSVSQRHVTQSISPAHSINNGFYPAWLLYTNIEI